MFSYFRRSPGENETTMTPEQLKSSVAKRSLQAVTLLEGGGRNTALEIAVELSSPLADQDLERLEVEGWHAASRPVPGTLPVLRVNADASRTSVLLEPIDRETIRLDTLFHALALRGSPLGSGLSAYVIQELSTIAHALHQAHDPDGHPRVHGAIHKGAVLITKSGTLLIVGPGLPLLNALLVHQPKDEIDRFRFLAPEAVRGEKLDARTDVYGLGVLYYELLSGHGYRRSRDGSEIFQATLEGHPPDLPGDLPDPRAELIELLRCALAPKREHRFESAHAFGAAVVQEVARLRLGPATNATLAGFVREFVTAEMDHGPRTLVTEGGQDHADSGVIGAQPRAVIDLPMVIAGASGVIEARTVRAPDLPYSSVERAPAGSDPAAGAPEPSSMAPSSAAHESAEPAHFAADDWAAVLGESVAPRPRPSGSAPSIAPHAPTPSKSSSRASNLPLPSGVDARVSGNGAAERENAPAIAPRPLPDSPLLALGDSPPSLGSLRAEMRTNKTPAQVKRVAAGLALLAALVIAGIVVLRGRSPRPAASREAGATRPALSPRARRAEPERPPIDRNDQASAPPTAPAPTPADPPAIRPVFLISILSTPSGATVELDGGYIGKTPLVLRHPFEKTAYRVSIANQGYRTWSQEVNVDPQKGTLTVTVTLQKQ